MLRVSILKKQPASRKLYLINSSNSSGGSGGAAAEEWSPSVSHLRGPARGP